MSPPNPQRAPRLRFHKGTGKYFVKLNGRAVYFPRAWPEDRCEAERLRLLAEWRATGRVVRPGGAVGQAVTVNVLLAAFLRHAESHYRHPDGSPTSEQDCLRMALRPLARLYGPTPVAEFGPLRLQALRVAMADGSWLAGTDRERAARNGRGKGWCRNVVNGHVRRVVRVFGWGVSQELVPEAVHRALLTVAPLPAGRGAARETAPVEEPSGEAVRTVRSRLCRQLQAAVDLQVLTGMRPGEVLALRPAEIDRTGEGLWFALPAELRGLVWVYRPRSKTAHHGAGLATHQYDRIIPISPEAQAVLLPWLEGRDGDAYCFSPAEAHAERMAARRRARKTRVQPSQRDRRKAGAGRRPGDRYTPTAYAHAVRRACGRVLAEGEHWHPHCLRHLAAGVLVRTYGKEVARVVLGHTTVAMIEQRYATAAALEADLLAAFRAIGRAG